MQTITLKIDDSIYENLLWLLNQFPKKKIRIIEKPLYTADDEKAYKKAVRELEQGEALSLNELKKELQDV
ncbi:MAG: hypothetical protein PHW04_09490 [Candidatus Wallbacteria bacterium]|nr:hypothetical protein [Candidatus Wallbacteria bacterium]